MRAAHTVEQVRAAEAVLIGSLPEGALMQRAAAGLAVAIANLLDEVYGAPVLLLVGSGDNGGDALYAGAMLARRGARVEAILLSENAHPAGLGALQRSGGRVVALDEAHQPLVLVDGIVGIGGRPGLRGDAVAALEAFPGALVVAVDTPSGVEVDTGRIDGPHVRADLTVTFGTHKICHLVDPAAEACGVVHLVDIGLDLPTPAVSALQATDVAALLPQPGPFEQKYTRGVVGVRAGSEQYPGAAVLCATGASSGLAGMVRYLGPSAAEVLARELGVVVGAGRVQAWVVGPGGGEQARTALAEALADKVPTVVDAAALSGLDQGRDDLVLTPHAGELAALLKSERGAVEASQLEHARRAAVSFGCVVVLKGRHTLIAHPDGRVRATTSGVPWLAIAGAGDVLAGLTGSLLAAGLSPFDAASAGSWLHGAAATYASAGGPLSASAVADAIPAVVRELLS
jgi:hydroxyethylthiazole kinase-like uncharacterized protein yjeF